MSAVNPIEPQPSFQKASAMPEQRPYEPSMEEILASIRRIIADDQSLIHHGAVAPSEPRLDTQHGEPPHSSSAEPPLPIVGTTIMAEATRVALTPEPVASLPEPVEPLKEPRAGTQAERRTMAFEPRHNHGEPSAYEPVAPAAGFATLSGHMAHGLVDAPQFAMPDSPVEFARYPAQRMEAAQPVPAHPATVIEEAQESLEHDERAENSSNAPPGKLQHDETPASGIALSSEVLFSAATDNAVTAAFKTLAATRLADNADELLDIARDMIRPLLKTWIDDNLPSMVERLVRAEIERVARGGR